MANSASDYEDTDPNEAYEVVPMAESESGPRGWFTVLRNGIARRHFASRDIAEKFAANPAWRALIAEQESRNSTVSQR